MSKSPCVCAWARQNMTNDVRSRSEKSGEKLMKIRFEILFMLSLSFAPEDSGVESPSNLSPSYFRRTEAERHELQRQVEFLETELEAQKESTKKYKEYIDYLEQKLGEYTTYMDFLQKETHRRVNENNREWEKFLSSPLHCAAMFFAALGSKLDQVNPSDFNEPC